MPSPQQKQIRRDRVALESAVKAFTDTPNAKSREAALSAIEKTALRGTKLCLTGAKDREEFATLVTELLLHRRGTIGLVGIDAAVKAVVNEQSLTTLTDGIPESVLTRLDKII